MTRHEYVERVIEPRIQRENELYHHGILGMKWGIRRYQNEDGSLTPEGRKRYYGADGKMNAEGRKATRQALSDCLKSNGYNHKSEEFSRMANNMWNERVDKEIRDAVKEKERAYMNASTNHGNGDTVDYYDSEQCQQDSRKAYDETLKYFKENEPEYINEIIADNNGSEENLDKYHDFRKTFEGFEDEAWKKGKREYETRYPNSSGKQSGMTDFEKAVYEYDAAKTQAIADMLGVGVNDKKHKPLVSALWMAINN